MFYMAKNIFMRADKELLEELKKMKIAKKESYAEVVKRLIEKEKKLKLDF